MPLTGTRAPITPQSTLLGCRGNAPQHGAEVLAQRIAEWNQQPTPNENRRYGRLLSVRSRASRDAAGWNRKKQTTRHGRLLSFLLRASQDALLWNTEKKLATPRN